MATSKKVVNVETLRGAVHDACFSIGKANVAADHAFLAAFVFALESSDKSILKDAIDGYYRAVVLKSKETESATMYVKMAASYFNILGATENSDGTVTYYTVDAKGRPLNKPDDDANQTTRMAWDASKSAESAFDARFRRISLIAHRGVNTQMMTLEDSGEIAVKQGMFMSQKDITAKPKKADSWTDLNSAQGRSIKKLGDGVKEYYAVKAKPRTRGDKGADVGAAAKEIADTMATPANVIKNYIPDTEAAFLKAFVGLAIHFNVINADKDGVVTVASDVVTRLYSQYTQLVNGTPAKEIWEDTEEEDDGKAEEKAA